MDDRCRDEIVDLHRFFEDWFNGKLAADGDDAGRLEASLGPKFERVGPDGRSAGRDAVIRSVREAHAGDAGGPGVRIAIEELRCRPLADALWLCSYRERQVRGGAETLRQSSAVLRRAEHAPHGVEWVHLHESWLDQE